MNRTLRNAIVASALCVGLISGCSGAETNDAPSPTDTAERIQVVCATFPAYDWTREVVGDQADRYDITYLMGSGVDLHSYQPTVEDIAKITDADLFVYVGGESDGWAADAVDTAANPHLHALSLLEAVGDVAVEEETVEGMQEEEHGHDHDTEGEDHDTEGEDHDTEGEDHEEDLEYDEHVWLSLKNAQVLVNAIAGELSAIDADAAQAYDANAQAYCAQLADLDARYAQTVASAAKDAVLFGDRFPFRYLTDDYDLSYYAAFAGCSAETEASFETVAFLAQKVDELQLGSVLVIENSDQRIAQTIVQNTKDKNQQILVMDSLQSTTTSDIDAGKTYLSAMKENLTVLSKALA